MRFAVLVAGVVGLALAAAVPMMGPSMEVLGQGATWKLPEYKVVVPPLPPMPHTPPSELPGPKAPHWGAPQAPGVDNYNLDGNPSEWWPDEFRSNPDSDIDLKNLKGYHLPPFLRWITMDKKVVKPGESIKGQALVEDRSEVMQWAIGFEGPHGRRITLNYQFRPRKDNPMLFDGELKVPKWAEPGRYLPFTSAINNMLGHSRGYFPEYVPALKDLVFEVLPNPDADVLPPTIEDFGIGWPGKSTAEGVTPSYNIKDSIPVWAKVTDNKSGVRSVTARILSPKEKFKEVNLRPWMGRENYYVGYFKIPPHYEGGEYYTSSVYASDHAGMELFTFFRTNPKVKAARFTVHQDPQMVDSKPPELVTAWLDKEQGKLGDSVKVSAIVSDDLSGVEGVVTDIASYPSFADKRRVHLKKVQLPNVLQKPGFNIEQNLWEGTFTTYELDEPGDWKVVRVFAYDGADNLMDVRRAEYPELLTISVHFKGGVQNLDTPAKATMEATTTAATSTAAPAAGPSGSAPKIRRVDMIPPHPPRGACLNCHEP